MTSADRERVVLQSIAIGAGSLFFVLLIILSFYRELGPDHPSRGPFIFYLLLGATALLSGFYLCAQPPGLKPISQSVYARLTMGLGVFFSELVALPAFLAGGGRKFGLHRGVGMALGIEGLVLIVVTLIAWTLMGRVPLPTQ